MNLVFWGKEHRCGTTTNMLATVAMLRLLYGDLAVIKGRFLHTERDVFAVSDCGTRMYGRSVYFLQSADLVVVNLRADKTCIDNFFGEEFCRMRKRIYVLCGYECERETCVSYMVHTYRVEPEHIIWMPFNSVIQSVMTRGEVQSYIEKEFEQPTCLANEEFVDAVRKLVACVQLNVNNKF